jgi:hypothetical protein
MSDGLCKMTQLYCWRLDFQETRCSDNPTLDDAARCIGAFDEHTVELAEEIAKLDQLLVRVNEQIASQKKVITSH